MSNPSNPPKLGTLTGLCSIARAGALLFGLLPAIAGVAGCVFATDSEDADEAVVQTESALTPKTIKIDFGVSSVALPSDWNDAQALVKSGSLQLKDSTGAQTAYTFSVTKPWNSTHTYGTTTAASGFEFPTAVTKDGVYGNVLPYLGFSAPRATMEVSGLKPTVTYAFQFFGSVKKGDTYNRDTLYRLVGGSTVSGHLDPTNNDVDAVNLSVKPNAAGVIRIEVENGAANNTPSGFYHLANLEISYTLSTYGTQRLVPVTSTEFGAPPPNGYSEYLPAQYSSSDTVTKWPLLIALHGIGEVGNGGSDLPKLLNSSAGLPGVIKDGKFPAYDKFIVLAPQHTSTSVMPVSKVKAFLDFAKAHYHVDTKRMYLTGLSLGGRAVWDYLNSTNATTGAYAEFAAATVMPGDGAYNNPLDCAKAGRTPLWAFQGGNDTNSFTSPTHAINAYNAINGCSTPPVEPSKLTIYEGVSHNCWTRTYNSSGMDTATWPGYSTYDVDIYSWMLAHKKP